MCARPHEAGTEKGLQTRPANSATARPNHLAPCVLMADTFAHNASSFLFLMVLFFTRPALLKPGQSMASPIETKLKTPQKNLIRHKNESGTALEFVKL